MAVIKDCMYFRLWWVSLFAVILCGVVGVHGALTDPWPLKIIGFINMGLCYINGRMGYDLYQKGQ